MQVAAYFTMDAPFFAVATPGVTYRYEYPWMNSWSLPVSAAVVDRLSLNVNAVIVGAELALVVCTVQEQVDVLPICVVPLLVTTLMVAVKDLMFAIASNRSARSVWDSVMVRSAVPFDQVLAESARYSVDPF